MALKFTSWGKLTEFVTDHVLSYEYWNVDAAIMDGEYARKHTVTIPLLTMDQLAQFAAWRPKFERA